MMTMMCSKVMPRRCWLQMSFRIADGDCDLEGTL